MVNKRGMLRVVEAIIAIMIVFGAVLTVATTNKGTSSSDFCDALPSLMAEIAENNDLRAEIVQGQTNGVEVFLDKRVRNPAIDYRVAICEPSDISCFHQGAGIDKVDVCAHERIVSGTLNQFAPKKLKVFLFKNQQS